MLNLRAVKDHLRIDHADDDVILIRYLSATTAYIEGKLSSPVISSSRTATYDALGTMDISPNLITVDSITYTDTVGAPQTLATDVYQVVTSKLVGEVILAHGKTWPDHRVYKDSVTVAYTAGYAVVPLDIEQAMLMYIGHLYNNAESSSPIEMYGVPDAVDALLAPHVKHNL